MTFRFNTGFAMTLRSLQMALLLSIPGLSMAASICEGLPPDLEIDCLEIYLGDLEPEATGFEINNALSGTWYNPERDGEGFMIDVANAGHIVISFYTYDNSGQQMWMIGTGDVDGSVAVIDFYVTEGGVYGAGFDTELIDTIHWGTGNFTFSECATGMAEIIPNQNYAAEFESLVTPITRLTVPVNCD